ncbi:MAG: hypothetical protein ACXVA4_10680 [Ktedonobacterales bacterium]
MQYNIWHFFYLRKGDQAYDTATIESMFAMLNRCGGSIDVRAHAQASTSSTAATPDVSAEAHSAIRRYVENGADEVDFAVECTDLAFSLLLNPKYGLLMLSVDSFTFEDYDGPGKGLLRYLRWLDMVRQLYAIWRPIYGFESADNLTEGFIDRDDALALTVTRLFSMANVFGPELVAKLGRERLLSAPSAYVAPLADGGVLLAPRIYTSLDALPPGMEAPCGTDVVLRLTCRDAHAVAQHIGRLEAFDWDAHLRERSRMLYNAMHQAAS